ncbi:hypothetical protein F4677DRAFT_101609 [Hypoxylon crocopeplum]|nr:hypothetical protein F4677DRAFT_101609 [Hypoxylon crocopeplum]
MEPDGKKPWMPYKKQSPEEAAQMDSVVREIQALYDANTRIFTRDAIRQAGEQLEAFRKGGSNGGEIVMKGINGVDYKVVVDPPREDRLPTSNPYLAGWRWRIFYHSIESLTIHKDAWTFDPQNAYLPMEIMASNWWKGNWYDYEETLSISSVEDLRRAFQDAEHQLRASKYYEYLQAALTTVEVPFALDKIVALALGTLALPGEVLERPMVQHAFVSTIHSSLLSCGMMPAGSRCYAQDPAYKETDIDALTSEGFVILQDPQALLILDESTVLVSINPGFPVKQIVADLCRPGMIIWLKEKDLTYITDPTSQRVTEMVEKEYYKVDLPDHESLDDLVMYVRKSG